MKKLLFSALIVGLVFTSSCNKDDDGGGKTCEQRIEDINEAAADYFDNPSTNNCEKYRDAMESYVDSDCGGGSTYEIILSGLNCS